MSKPTQSQLLKAARIEIEDFHLFFLDWFTGNCENNEELLQDRHGSRLADEFLLIYPGGQVLDRTNLIDEIRQAYGGTPGFGIQIRNIQLRPMNCRDYLLANYEEWQRNAVNSKPSNNARQTSVIFRMLAQRPLRFEWLHMHETWLPRKIVESDPFNF